MHAFYNRNKLNQFKSRFFPALLRSEQLIKRLKIRNYNVLLLLSINITVILL